MTQCPSRDDYERSRTFPRKMPEGWHPPVPAYSDAADLGSTIAYIGVQAAGGAATHGVASFQAWITNLGAGPHQPETKEYAEFVDASGHYTWVAIFYWREGAESFLRWQSSVEFRTYWDDPARLADEVGVFREVFGVDLSRWETIYSNAHLRAGVATNSGEHNGPIAAHNYWGAMRDRLPLSAIDSLAPAETASSAPDAARLSGGVKRRIHLAGTPNLAIIQSGQLVGEMANKERELYQAKLAGVLQHGMDYLRDNPSDTGCYSCRFMTETDANGRRLERERTFGLAAFVSLRHLEQWAAHHPSHLSIFHGFLEYAKEVGGDPTLGLWHQVLVPTAGGQLIEYVNCHEATGFLPYRDFVEIEFPG